MTRVTTNEILALTTGGKSVVLDCVQGESTESVGLAEALKKLGARRRSRVLVLHDAVYAQTVRMAAIQTDGLTPDELESALFYEIEPFCGLNRAEAYLAYEKAGESEWKVVALSHKEAERIRNEVESAGCSLTGYAAIPAGMADMPAGEWKGNFAGALNPVIMAERHAEITGRKAVGIWLTAIVMLILGCSIDGLLLVRKESKLRPQVAASERVAAENARIKRETQDASIKAQGIMAAREKRKKDTETLAAARGGIHALLTSIAAAADGNFAVLSLTNTDGAIEADCVAADADVATKSLETLEQKLVGKGWKIAPGKIRTEAGHLASFSFVAQRRPLVEGE